MAYWQDGKRVKKRPAAALTAPDPNDDEMDASTDDDDAPITPMKPMKMKKPAATTQHPVIKALVFASRQLGALQPRVLKIVMITKRTSIAKAALQQLRVSSLVGATLTLQGGHTKCVFSGSEFSPCTIRT